MAIQVDKLSAVGIKALSRPDAPAKKHFDGAGLYLDVRETGARYWRMNYRFAGRPRLLALGTFPEVGLAEARRRRDAAKALLRDGIDPVAAKADRKAADRRIAEAGFPKVATAWVEFRRADWAPETYRKAK